MAAALGRAVAARQLFPLVCGAAKTGCGIGDLLEAVVRYLPPPAGRPEAPAAAVVFRDLEANRQAEACSPAHALCREAGIEDFLQVRGRNADAGIRDLHLHHITLSQRLDADLALLGNGLRRIHQQVHEDLIDLAGGHAQQPQGAAAAPQAPGESARPLAMYSEVAQG